jgi:hypothetical protein
LTWEAGNSRESLLLHIYPAQLPLSIRRQGTGLAGNRSVPETLKRVNDMITLNRYDLPYEMKGEENPDNRFGLSLIVSDYGVRINYSEKTLQQAIHYQYL